MGILSEAEHEWLEAHARPQAEQNKSSQAIVASLWQYCLGHGIEATDGELFLIADLVRSQQASAGGSEPAQASKDFAPRKLKDRRTRDRRQRPGRSVDRRRTGLEAKVEALRRVGQPERRSGRDRRSGIDRRRIIRRRHIRRHDER